MSELIETYTPPPVPDLARVASAEECTAEIDGIRWRYLRAGTGPALLLVHGVTAYSFSWRFVIEGLANCYTVYAVDLPVVASRSEAQSCQVRWRVTASTCSTSWTTWALRSSTCWAPRVAAE